jgi:predicted enzyme related to lactoylglutathione lyase
MNIHPLHTVICTDKVARTVNFYEDFFGYSPVFERGNHVILRRNGVRESELAVVGVDHVSIPDGFRNVTTGLMLNFYVEDLEESFEHFYYEGLDIASEMSDAPCGEKYFILRDPNNNLITIMKKEHRERNSEDPANIEIPFDATCTAPQHQIA